MEERPPYGSVIMPQNIPHPQNLDVELLGDVGTQTLGFTSFGKCSTQGHVEIVVCQWWKCPYCFLHILVNS